MLTALACAQALAWARTAPVVEPVNWSGGVVCSLIAWLFILSFHVRRETAFLRFAEREAFTGALTEALLEMGYEVSRPSAERLVGKPSFAALLFSGVVQVHMQGNTARISGPKLSIERLRQHLRMQSHLENNRRTLADSTWSTGQGRLRSVQIQFRLPAGAQQQQVAGEIVDALAQAGAAVQCDVAIWAQSDRGIDELLVEKIVRDRLKQRGISAAVHKKPLPGAAVHESNAVLG